MAGMQFKPRNVEAIANMVIGDVPHFEHRSSYYIIRFMQECDLDDEHDGTTRWRWTTNVLDNLLADPSPTVNCLPDRFVKLLRVLMDKRDAQNGDVGSVVALAALHGPLGLEGFEAFYGDDDQLYTRHIATCTVSAHSNPHRPFTPTEIKKRERLAAYLNVCSEDQLIEELLLPLLRQLGFHRITPAGHKDKNLEHGKDAWMRFTLPSQHMLYFGIQAKGGKLDASADTKNRAGANTNIAVIHNQVLMMLNSEIFDPELSRRVLVDHAYILAGGEITKSARMWLAQNLDATRRSRIMFMD